MKILGVESSAVSASVAVLEDGKIISLQYINTGLTHSQTLMPMVNTALNNVNLSVEDIDYLAVSKGPGSFTGVRIGVSVVKGLGFVKDMKCVPVSTLEVIAEPLSSSNSYVVSVMDARCNQFYTASFVSRNGELIRLCDDRAISADELKADLLKLGDKPIVLTGDGTNVAYSALSSEVHNIIKADISVMYQSASALTAAAYKMLLKDEDSALPVSDVLPDYLRLSQAERELKNKNK